MIPVVVMAFLALSLNNTPPAIGMGSGGGGSPAQAPQHQEKPYLTVIRRNIYQVNSCFDSARAWAPRLQGEVVVEWDIGEAGDVQKAEVTGNTTGKPDLANCILQAVKGWRFNEPNASYPSHVSHAFRLQVY